MSKEKKNKNEEIAEDTATEATEAAESLSEESAAASNTAEAPDLLSRVAALEAEIKEKDDKYLRLAAEYDNFRRRSAQERAQLYTDAASDTVKELLPIFDDLERAALYTEGDKVLEGLGIIMKSVQNVLTKLGVSSYGEVGDVFDPAWHNAVMHDEDAEKPESTVTDVFQKGYKKGDKVIRYAMVKVVN